jgi:hypothetical protein
LKLITNLIVKYITKHTIVFISMMMLCISLTQNAFSTVSSNSLQEEKWVGYYVFLFGWIKIFGAGISWLANPILLCSWIFLVSKGMKWIALSLFFSLLPLLFSSSFMIFHTFHLDVGLMPERDYEIIKYGIGYWLWFLSCVINFIGNLILYLTNKNL